MKRTDVISIIMIAGFFMVVAYFGANLYINSGIKQVVQVKTIEAITDTIVEPDSGIFNSEAINPSVEINVGSGS